MFCTKYTQRIGNNRCNIQSTNRQSKYNQYYIFLLLYCKKSNTNTVLQVVELPQRFLELIVIIIIFEGMSVYQVISIPMKSYAMLPTYHEQQHFKNIIIIIQRFPPITTQL